LNAAIMMDFLSPSSFLWATGFEDIFIPHTRPGLRALDEYEWTQHYKLWKRDFDFVAETGVKAVCWGIPLYRVQPATNRWGWAYRRGRHPLKDYLIHLGLYDSVFDSKGILRRRKTPLVKRYQGHIANPMLPIGN
jgi:hypothetical protein